MAKKSVTCACIFRWGSRFEAVTSIYSPSAGVVAAVAYFAGGVVGGIRAVVDWVAVGYAHVAGGGCTAV